ncbi:MAG: SH3 domain-containing protein [Oscillospiraceae bacterium]|nr:SH3 domain-containing protein [Oscillospiraceae bacterium]
MPKVFLSPSTQEWNAYVTTGNEEKVMNQLADAMEPYLRASGIEYVRNDPARNVGGAIADSNAGWFDVHLALHSNAAPEQFAGKLRGVDFYFSPVSYESERLATILSNNMKNIYPLPDHVTPRPTTSLGEVTQTRAVSVLAELGYHDNPEDATWLQRNLDAIAKNLTISLTDYFGIPFIEPTPTRLGTVVTDGSNLNLRSYPSMYGTIIGVLPNGAKLFIDGQSGNWYVVRYQGKSGYVSSDFVNVGSTQ